MTDLVTIVVPAFNNAQFIRETLHSIFAQTYSNLEVIVSDHSSNDATLQVVSEFSHDPRLTVLSLERGGGAPRNWNFVSSHARGTFLKLVCADDLISPRCIELQVSALLAHPSAAMASSPRQIIDANGRTLIASRGLKAGPSPVPGADAVRQSVRSGTNIFGEPACVLFRTQALRDIGFWDEKAAYLLDQSTYFNVLLEGDLAIVPENLASFRVSETQWSVRLASAQAKESRQFYRKFRSLHPQVVTATDSLLGQLKASANAAARRLVYLWLGLRMKGNKE